MQSWQNPDDERIRQLLRESRTIAVVGCSPDPQRSSHQIAQFLIERGYHVIPVHPRAGTILGRRAYARLEDIPESVDIVDVFRRPDATPPIAHSAVTIGAKALWLQQGIVNEEAWRIATEGGLLCVMDRCIAVMYSLLMR
ncbi:MAG: CoA-binding protein [Zetaproteobacteria bacterium]|nr:MAG: CoA-binding protein [Zetaproteobacteria bacterium]